MTILIRVIMVLPLGMLALTLAARAGDGDYGAGGETGGDGPAFFGFVRDTRGSPVPDARVVLHPKTGEPVTLKSNVLGLYRSHVGKDTRPDDVSVSCAKDGYKQANVIRRTPPGSTTSLIETNCTLQRL